MTCTRVVSKADGSQSLDLQRDALETAGVDEVGVYRELASGVRDDPAGLDSCPPPLCKGMSGRLVFGIFAALAEGELIRAVTAVRPMRLARRPLARRDVVAPAHHELLDPGGGRRPFRRCGVDGHLGTAPGHYHIPNFRGAEKSSLSDPAVLTRK